MYAFIISVIITIFIIINNIVYNIILAYCVPGPLCSSLHIASHLFPLMSSEDLKYTYEKVLLLHTHYVEEETEE